LSDASSTSTLASSSTLATSFMTESTMMVSHNDLNEKGIRPDDDYYWTLQSWIMHLPKITLCHIISSTAQQHPKIYQQIVEEHCTGPPTHTPSEILCHLLTIKERAKVIVHGLDMLRPSEQFARAYDVADGLQCLVRLVTSTLHTPLQGHSLLALAGLWVIITMSLEAPSEVRQHLFHHAKFGRTFILEAMSVLKNYKQHPDAHAQWITTMHFLYPTHAEWVESLSQIGVRLARLDTSWEFRREYEEVTDIAKAY
ncbi:hypothetical protein BDF14DRAFT_1696267, partial [Spinellus fusiger]